MPVPQSCCDRKRKITRSSSLQHTSSLHGLHDYTTIEESTVKVSDFDLPLTLSAVCQEMNPAYKDISLMDNFLAVLEQTNIISPENQKKHRAWRSLKIDMLASLTAPLSTPDQLLCYTLWMALVYTIDDVRDKFLLEDTPVGTIEHQRMIERYIEIVRDTNDDILGLVDSEADVMPPLKYFSRTDAVVLLGRYLREKTLDCYDRGTYNEFVGHLTDHLRHGVTISTPHVFSMKAGKPFPMRLPEYEVLRTRDSAGAMCVHIAGATSYGNCSDKAILDKCLELAALHAALLNDIFSYEKQIYREQDRFNYVCALEEKYSLSFNDATHRTVERANELVSEHARLSALVDPTDRDAQRILDTHRRWFAGHIAWVKKCGRYSSQSSPFQFLRSTASTMDSSLSPED